jgi:hypothetical protein
MRTITTRTEAARGHAIGAAQRLSARAHNEARADNHLFAAATWLMVAKYYEEAGEYKGREGALELAIESAEKALAQSRAGF